MAARKKPPSTPPAPPLDAAHFTVILEDIRAQNSVFVEALQSSREESARNFQKVDQRFDQVDRRLDQHDRRFASIEGTIVELRRDIGGIRGDIGGIRGDIVGLRGDIVGLRGSVERIEIALDSKVNRDEVESIVPQSIRRP